MDITKDSGNDADIMSLSDRILQLERAKVLQFDRSNKKQIRQNGKGVKFSTATPEMKTWNKKEESKMATFSTDGSTGMPSFINTGSDGGLGGGGLLGTLLAVSLLGRGGLGGIGGNNWGSDGVVGGSAAVLNATTLDTIQQTLGDIKASVPLAEGQVQLALSNAMASLTNQINQGTGAVLAGQGSAALSAAVYANQAARDIAAVETEVARESNAIQMVVKEDGERTRSLITNNLIADLNSKLVIAANEAAELRDQASRTADTHGINISMINNQNQNQMQFQAQSQAMNQLVSCLNGMQQSIHATNQAINIGSGSQRATPSNNNTNVTA